MSTQRRLWSGLIAPKVPATVPGATEPVEW